VRWDTDPALSLLGTRHAPEALVENDRIKDPPST
jgi:hypothetical protein